jgi:hypothetical protein
VGRLLLLDALMRRFFNGRQLLPFVGGQQGSASACTPWTAALAFCKQKLLGSGVSGGKGLERSGTQVF